MEFVEKFGPDVESAIELALEDLNIKKEEAKIEVLEEPKKGILGLGGNPAKVRVSRLKGGEEKTSKADETEKKSGVIDLRQKKENQGSIKKEEDTTQVVTEADLEITEAEEIESGEMLELTKEIIKKTKLNITVKLYLNKKKETYFLELFGEDANYLIGKKGANISSIQYLFNLIFFRANIKERVFVDIENYKRRHVTKNVKLALKKAHNVKKFKKSASLHPMTKQERKNIHEAIAGIEGIKSYSKGNEPKRYVVIAPADEQEEK